MKKHRPKSSQSLNGASSVPIKRESRHPSQDRENKGSCSDKINKGLIPESIFPIRRKPK